MGEKQNFVQLYGTDGNILQDKEETVQLSGVTGKPWIILDDDGKPMKTDDVAALYGLSKSTKGRPASPNSKNPQLLWDHNEKTGELVMAAVIPNNIDTTYDYLTDLDELSETSLDASKETELARLLYDNEGICTGVINVLVENANTGGYVSVPETIESVADKGERKPGLAKRLLRRKKGSDNTETARILCETWMQYVNNFGALDLKGTSKDDIGIVGAVGGLDAVLSQGSLCYHRDGDWVATQTWAKVKIPQLENKAFNLPIRITTHDKSSLTFSESGAKLGLDIIEWEVPGEIKTIVNEGPGNDKTKKVIHDAISEELRKRIKSGETRIPLPANRTTHLKRCGEDWKANGKSHLRPMMHVLADKNRIRRMDRATIIGMINRLVFIMLGSEDRDSPFHQPDPKRFRLFKKALTNMRTMSWILWNGWDIKIEDLSPDSEILNFEEKYKEVDSDLWIAANVPRILIDGQGSGGSEKDWSAFTGMINKLAHYRLLVNSWVDMIFQAIMLDNKIKDVFPVYTMRPLGLRNVRDVWQVVNTSFQSSLIGRRDALHELGKNPDAFISNQLREAEEGLNDIIVPPQSSHTQGGDGRPQGVPDGGGKKKTKTDTDENTETATLKASNEFEDRLREAYNTMVNNVMVSAEQEKDKRKIIAWIIAGFGVFLGITNEIINNAYRSMAPDGENRWGMELEMWNTSYVQRFSIQAQTTVQHYIEAFERGEIGKDILLFQIKTYLLAQVYRIPMYAEEIPAKVELAVRLEKLGIEKTDYVRPRTVGDEFVCDQCLEAEAAGTVMTLSEFFARYPLHARGRCYPEAVLDFSPHQEKLVASDG